MAKFIMEGFGISNASFDQKGLSLDVDKIDFVLTTNSATSFSYEYTGSHQSVAVDMTGGFSLKYDGAKLGLNGFDLAIGYVRKAVALCADNTPAGCSKPGIKTEYYHYLAVL